MLACCSDVLNRFRSKTRRSDSRARVELHTVSPTTANKASDTPSESSLRIRTAIKEGEASNLRRDPSAGLARPRPVDQPAIDLHARLEEAGQPSAEAAPPDDQPSGEVRPRHQGAHPKVGTGWPPYQMMERPPPPPAKSKVDTRFEIREGFPGGVHTASSSSAPSESGEDRSSITRQANSCDIEDARAEEKGSTADLIPLNGSIAAGSTSSQEAVGNEGPLIALSRGRLMGPEAGAASSKDQSLVEAPTTRDDRKSLRATKNKNRRVARKRRRVAFLEAVSRTAAEVAASVLTAAVTAAPGNQEVVRAVVDAARLAVARAEEMATTMSVSYQEHTPVRISAFKPVVKEAMTSPWSSAPEAKGNQALATSAMSVDLTWATGRGDDSLAAMSIAKATTQAEKDMAMQRNTVEDAKLRELTGSTLGWVDSGGQREGSVFRVWKNENERSRPPLGAAEQVLYKQSEGQEILRPTPWTPMTWQPWQ